MSQLDIENHWIKQAKKVPSPNFNDRPDEATMNLLVIHNISLPPNQFGGNEIIDFFTNKLDWSSHPFFETIKGVEVSSHLLIRREGEIVQFVPFNKRAWHAGRSEYNGQQECNDFSVGVEMEGSDEIPYTEEQYQALCNVTQCLIGHYPDMVTSRITGHEDIAPGRKTDPGIAFDWNYYHNLLDNK